MKKLILIIIAIVTISCSTPSIDKKINVTEYNTVIKQIKSLDSQFNEQDFKTAAKEMDKLSFNAMSSGNNTLNITYKQLLTKAKEINTKNKKTLEIYNNKLQKLKDVCSIKILTGNYLDLTDRNLGYSNAYKVGIKITNKTDKTITAITGKILLFNQNKEQILSYTFKNNTVISPKQIIEKEDFTIIFEDDNLTELKALPFSKITQQWLPKTIIFNDGSRLDAPTKPYM